ncbi:hypothetical protein BJV85_002095 [Clostridium acetobutylicum]|uniref:Uncharacterized protein n=1 Tax=Clostridium acetobutylicum (strain ATCC 824 / DSM 792 / JCM 1419 / IAM 19013 / LMG 5710 / NBRC 13948 / NRRL B-527 / VKM B-1787 / 2291 / W) TaxID=272562 RepID=Q97HV5_CLOAB|nr:MULTISPECIES: hypothetical protein [Clostridium]AAK79865.1 Hypothetical protein CA_C1902 [Clostridium acetobutylicum ATCC 824]ADZ20951.1 Conserved hypothetical protein [Clostridium acetobutylicum EA 2018]AEI32040.1 hypothetical protein SMB_G1927 [Clostridium acetobutylicum DSM 1731]AWV79706.1 hypothetical protein DK921_06250 [Clostridium acetobutylicum]MBC2394317.1 hypothetical protein [Clostridium acetobutylicum]
MEKNQILEELEEVKTTLEALDYILVKEPKIENVLGETGVELVFKSEEIVINHKEAADLLSGYDKC